jgi:hypothetical protein
MTATHPDTAVYVNRRRPQLEKLLRTGADGRPLAPGGSARDLFLHATPGCEHDLVDDLRDLLRDDARVHRVADLVEEGLFGPDPSSRLLERLGNVVVLPEAGGSVWWWEAGRFEQPYHGHHGGLSADEMEIPMGRLDLG